MLTVLIQPRELREKIDKPKVLVIDVRGRDKYEHSHIPGAVHCDLFNYHWADSSPSGIRAFLGNMAKVFSNVGVSYQKRVIFYEDDSGMGAARGVWLLEALGHGRVSMLDGGFKVWIEAGYEIESKLNPTKPEKFRPRPRLDLIASAKFILTGLGTDELQIIDSRSLEEYQGELVRAARGGRIPKAHHVDWRQNLDENGKFLPTGKLRRLYETAGIRERKEVVTYCQGGYRAAHTYVALRLLGFRRVRVYLTSWFEWGNDSELPVET